MKTKTEKLLQVMKILSWVVFIGLMIDAGGILISYFVSISNPEAAKNLYKGLDLYIYRQNSFGQYSIIIVYTSLIRILEAYIAYQMTRLLTTLNISKPFTMEVVILMQSISLSTLIIWGVTMIYNLHIAILAKNYGIEAKLISGDFVFLAGIVYVFAQMFKRGIEMQSENELTV